MSLETMTKLATTTLSTSAASVTFSNIPQHFTDLKLVMSARGTRTGTDTSVGAGITFNGDGGAYYTTRMIEGDGTGTRSATDSSQTSLQRFDLPTDNATSNTFSNSEMYIPNYTSTNPKSTSLEAVAENNATLAYVYLAAGLYSPPSNVAISSVTLTGLSSSTFDTNSTFTLYGIKNARQTAGNSIKATGGNISFDGTYVVHTFNTSGTFTPSVPLIADYLVVAGGGGGGQAGGGAGGLRSTVTATGGGGTLETALSLTAGTSYTATVGAGGAGGTGSNGNNSVFSTITATAGGGGGSAGGGGLDGGNGGSGGGAAHQSVNNGTPGTGTANQGYAGGATGGASGQYACGAGGGAGAVGGAGNSNSSGGSGGAGGNGVSVSISGSSVTYAGGGGGGADITPGAGGTGGGGAGAIYTGVAGTENSGGGGGGGNNTAGGTGGSGIIIIRYKG